MTDFKDYQVIMDAVRNTLAASPTPIKLLAIRVGVSPSALYSIANGKTAWPRHSTLFPLLDVLGLRLVITVRPLGDRVKPRHQATPLSSARH